MCLPLRKACLTHCVFIQIFKIYKQNSQQQIVEYAPEEIKKKNKQNTQRNSLSTHPIASMLFMRRILLGRPLNKLDLQL